MSSSSIPPVPETRVLAIASHVVYGYVGNTMAVFVMQTLGFEVAAINTVQFSNHSGYLQKRGTVTSPEEITSIYNGLKDSYLDDFDMMLTGYIPSAAGVAAIGSIARELKLKANMQPGSFFWVLDPVMGDNGKMYVAEGEAVLAEYKKLLWEADLVVPNQWEAEWLSSNKITDLPSLTAAITSLHATYHIPHIIITSVAFPASSSPSSTSSTSQEKTLSVIGSTITSIGTPRIFKIDIPAIDCMFSGTGDMFAALMVVRLREEVWAADQAAGKDKTTNDEEKKKKTEPQDKEPKLTNKRGWISPDSVPATQLPLAKAAERVLGSMHGVLKKTKEARDQELGVKEGEISGAWEVEGMHEEERKSERLRRVKAAEVRLVGSVDVLMKPEGRFKAEAVEVVLEGWGKGEKSEE